MIIFEEVSKSYGGKAILDRVSFEISGGEFVSIVGESGVGKSTLINLLIGATKPSNGKVVVDKYVINDLDENMLALYRRKLGVVFQDFKLLEKKTVWENIAFALEVCGEEDAKIEKRVKEVLEIVGLSRRKNAFPKELSGGEMQRVGIARALVHNPALVIADEPTGNLDPKASKEIIDLLLDINRAGATVILATHNKEEVNRINRRVIRLEDGKVKSDLSGGYEVEVVEEVIEVVEDL